MRYLRFTDHTTCSIPFLIAPFAGPLSETVVDRLSHISITVKTKTLCLSIQQGIYNSSSVTQVNIPAATGDMGILANHVPTVEALRPGLLEIIESSGTKKYFGTSRGWFWFKEIGIRRTDARGTYQSPPVSQRFTVTTL